VVDDEDVQGAELRLRLRDEPVGFVGRRDVGAAGDPASARGLERGHGLAGGRLVLLVVDGHAGAEPAEQDRDRAANAAAAARDEGHPAF
jgi:hypothetical protein